MRAEIAPNGAPVLAQLELEDLVLAKEWQERKVPEIGRRANDRLIIDVSESVVRLEGKVDRLIENHKTFQDFLTRYAEKSEETSDPHRWIKNTGAPTAKDFNRLKTMLITVGAVIALLWTVFKVVAPELLRLSGH